MSGHLNEIMNAALGREPFDLLIENARYLNLFTEEIYSANIGIKHGKIAYISQPDEADFSAQALERYDAKNKIAIPGLIDTHVHIESSMISPANFAKAVIPHGTTTILADPHEFCNVMGLAGLQYFLEASENIELRVFVAAPSCVPSVVGVETSMQVFNAPEIRQMLSRERVLSLGEVMDYTGLIEQDPRMMSIVEEGRKSGKLIQGHLANVSARELAAYMIAGCESDHEARGLEEAIRYLRSGLVLECRYASNCHNMPILAQALKQMNYPSNATMCTDDREPDDLVSEGHIDEVVRQAIQAGIPPIQAIKLATVNAAAFMRLHNCGSLKPGNLADIVLLDSLEEFKVNEVFISGSLCAKNNKMQKEIMEPHAELAEQNTMYIKRELSLDDFHILAEGDSVELNFIQYNKEDPFLTQKGTGKFKAEEGRALIHAEPEYTMMVVIERHGINGDIGKAPIADLGMKDGAIAGTVSHDSHNLFVLGKDAEDMLMAAKRVSELGGGFVCVKDKKVLAEVALPICGLVSKKTAEEIGAEVAKLKQVLNDRGIYSHSPLNLLTAFSLAVLPEIRLTDQGLIDTLSQKKIPLYCKDAE